jgi:hypothetical protein
LPKETALPLVALCLVLADPTHAEDWSAWQRAYEYAQVGEPPMKAKQRIVIGTDAFG